MRTAVALMVALLIVATPAAAVAAGRGRDGATTTTTTTTLVSSAGAADPYASCTAQGTGQGTGQGSGQGTGAGAPGQDAGGRQGAAYLVYKCELRVYRQATAQIDGAFRSAVALARAQYQRALLAATSSSQRSAALQLMEAAVIQAATVRSAALTALGPAPEWHGHR